MRLGYIIRYVPDVEASVAFYERAFGLKRIAVHGGDFGELATGETRLCFCAERLIAQMGLAHRPTRPDELPPGCEAAFITGDVDGAFARAVEAGAVPVMAPVEKPWGQTVAYVRDRDGALVELCTAMDAGGDGTP